MTRKGDGQMTEAADVYTYLREGFLLDDGDDNPIYRKRWSRASAQSYDPPDLNIHD
jgi:hypothetical protein